MCIGFDGEADRRRFVGARLWKLFVCFLGASILLAACSRSPGPGIRPNVLLITIDTLRADRLSCYGYEGHQTPHIDALAASGALFETSFCDVTWTTPSMASVMTGTYATIHGMKVTPQRLDPRNLTMAEILSEHGYTTAAIIGSLPLDSIWGLDQGFASYDDEFTTPLVLTDDAENPRHVESRFSDDPDEMRKLVWQKSKNDGRRTDPEVSAAAFDWLETMRQEPFFLWVHYFGPHSRPDRRQSYLKNAARHRRSYDGYVRETDTEIGRLLDRVAALGLDPNTLVILHSDHGESLGEHGVVGHGKNLFEPTLRIPLIVRYPGHVGQEIRVTGLARNIDLLPTILDFLEIEQPDGLDGESLAPAIGVEDKTKIRALPPRRSMYAETYQPTQAAFARHVTLPDGSETKVGIAYQGVRTTEWKLVRTRPVPFVGRDWETYPEAPPAVLETFQSEMLFDLRDEPSELTDVSAEQSEIASRLRAALNRFLESEQRGLRAEKVTIDQETRDRLRALGYEAD